MQTLTQQRRPRRQRPFMSTIFGFGALCFIALLPFLLFQQDNYEQRRLLSGTSYQQHANHPHLKGFRRTNRRKGNLTEATRLRNTIQRQISPPSTIRDERNCLVVFHLPKTGGSSLLYALRYFALERGWELYNYHGESNTTGDANGEPTKPPHRAIHYGHFYSTFLERSSTSKCLRMTLLRDPIDRVISHFYYWKGEERNWPRVKEIAKECEGNPLLQRNSNQFSNLMTRMLAGGSQNGTVKVFPSHLWHIFQTESSQCQYSYPLNEEALTNSAIDHLKEMDLVCFMDDLDGCLQNVRRILGLPSGRVVNVPHKNSVAANAGGGKVRVRPHDLAMKNSTIRDMIATVNKADLSLYAWALKNAKE